MLKFGNFADFLLWSDFSGEFAYLMFDFVSWLVECYLAYFSVFGNLWFLCDLH